MLTGVRFLMTEAILSVRIDRKYSMPMVVMLLEPSLEIRNRIVPASSRHPPMMSRMKSTLELSRSKKARMNL